MQRASTVTSIIDRSKGSMSVRVAQELNDYDNGFGIMTGRNHEITYLSKNFTNIVLGYTNKADIDIDATFCGDNCTTTIKVCCPERNESSVWHFLILHFRLSDSIPAALAGTLIITVQ